MEKQNYMRKLRSQKDIRKDIYQLCGIDVNNEQHKHLKIALKKCLQEYSDSGCEELNNEVANWKKISGLSIKHPGRWLKDRKLNRIKKK